MSGKTKFLRILAGTLGMIATGLGEEPVVVEAKPGPAEALKVLVVTGGCCHDYEFQSTALMAGISRQLNVDFTVVNAGGKGTQAEIELYNDANWAKPYAAVIHNECFADTKDPAYLKKIVDGHRDGVPAMVIHCAMHTYRAAEVDDWRKFLGVTSRHHDHQSEYPVKVVAEEHPVMKDFPKDWKTPMDELYIIEKTWPGTVVLATSVSERSGEVQPVAWVHELGQARVFGTTFGHTNETFADPVFLKMLAEALKWITHTEEDAVVGANEHSE